MICEVELVAETAARVLICGGAPLDGERVIWWNFVASSAFALLHGSGNGIITIARGGVLLVSSALSVSACLALCLLRARRAAHAD